MYLKDFTDYKFHASDMAGLVDTFIKNHYSDTLTAKQREIYNNLIQKGSKSKTLAELQAKIDKKENQKHLELEEATKTTLYNIWCQEAVGVNEFVSSKSTTIGNEYEQASIDLLNQIYKQGLTKNEKFFSNDYFCGTPDIVGTQSIIDVKTKTKFTLFDKASQKTADDYFWQLWTYKKLTNLDKVFIAFVLPSQSDEDILLEQNQKIKGIKDLDLIKKIKEQVYNNMNFDRLPIKSRIKLFEITTLKLKDSKELNLNQIDEGLVCEYLEQCRAYLNGITKNNLQYFKQIN